MYLTPHDFGRISTAASQNANRTWIDQWTPIVEDESNRATDPVEAFGFTPDGENALIGVKHAADLCPQG